VEELRCLIEIGFDTAQGFLFAKPMPCSQFRDFVAGPQSASPGTASPAAPSAAPRAAQA
jgi:sensor c-di-GMP phosphodiesterase-like protein